MKFVVRDETTGNWQHFIAPKAAGDKRSIAEGDKVSGSKHASLGTTVANYTDPVEQAMASSLIRVTCNLPYGGPTGSAFFGTGLIVDAAKGLVLVDRLTAPSGCGDFTLTFFDSIKIPARVSANLPSYV